MENFQWTGVVGENVSRNYQPFLGGENRERSVMVLNFAAWSFPKCAGWLIKQAFLVSVIDA
jgi:hypothetical protein